ncbi:hypothetical protein HAX54_033868 [Datura stramonium]|uniref:Uncharacterized protein n=1 Tax=Datura stramonium TaxID=4076 RepID=A0ABS8SDT0_DATST|nr:hypothetical protein [Datura stramonium]
MANSKTRDGSAEWEDYKIGEIVAVINFLTKRSMVMSLAMSLTQTKIITTLAKNNYMCMPLYKSKKSFKTFGMVCVGIGWAWNHFAAASFLLTADAPRSLSYSRDCEESQGSD